MTSLENCCPACGENEWKGAELDGHPVMTCVHCGYEESGCYGDCKIHGT